MFAREHRLRTKWKIWSFVAALVAMVGSIVCIFGLASRPSGIAVDYSFVEKLKSAKHVKSSNPAPRQTIWLARNGMFKAAAFNAIGIEPRDVAGAAGGYPDSVFHLLAHFRFGEIVWVDQWTNFSVKLPPPSHPSGAVPRRKAVRAFLASIRASGGCLIKAGESRYLVAKVEERNKYEAAIQALGWLKGKQPPWAKENDTRP